MRIRFPGSSSCIPDPGTDTSCLLINDHLLIDTGWAPVLRMNQMGIDPLNVDTILFSHFHADHYLGLVQLLFFLGLRVPADADEPQRQPLIAGPGEHLERVVLAAQDYLQPERFPRLRLAPRLHPLAPGDGLDVGGLRIEVAAARHTSSAGIPEPSLAYRVSEDESGGSFFFSGDTHPCPELAEAAHGVQLLIHDGAHSSPEEAAQTALRSEAVQLILTHIAAAQSTEMVERARAVFANTRAADPDLVVELP